MKDASYQTNYEPDTDCWVNWLNPSDNNCKQVSDESTMFMIDNCGIRIDEYRVAITFMLVTASRNTNDKQV